MRRLLRWLRALLGQSRIRLSPLDLARPELAPDDRVEIGERLWRVASVSGATGEIIALEGPTTRALLRADPAGGWRLEDGESMLLAARDVIVYPWSKSSSLAEIDSPHGSPRSARQGPADLAIGPRLCDNQTSDSETTVPPHAREHTPGMDGRHPGKSRCRTIPTKEKS